MLFRPARSTPGRGVWYMVRKKLRRDFVGGFRVRFETVTKIQYNFGGLALGREEGRKKYRSIEAELETEHLFCRSVRYFPVHIPNTRRSCVNMFELDGCSSVCVCVCGFYRSKKREIINFSFCDLSICFERAEIYPSSIWHQLPPRRLGSSWRLLVLRYAALSAAVTCARSCALLSRQHAFSPALRAVRICQ